MTRRVQSSTVWFIFLKWISSSKILFVEEQASLEFIEGWGEENEEKEEKDTMGLAFKFVKSRSNFDIFCILCASIINGFVTQYETSSTIITDI